MSSRININRVLPVSPVLGETTLVIFVGLFGVIGVVGLDAVFFSHMAVQVVLLVTVFSTWGFQPLNENFTEEQARSYLKEMLPKLDYWKK